MPNTRLVPGGPLLLDPPDVKDRPFIKEIVDEDSSGVAGAIFMYSGSGIRGFFDTDNCHRFNNDFNSAIRKADLWHIMALITHVACVNRGPWLGGDFLEKKAESMMAMLSCICCDPLEMTNHFEGMAFDRGLTLSAVQSVHDLTALAPIAVKQWLDMGSFTKRSGAAGILEQISRRLTHTSTIIDLACPL
jgi:hypothetical protein